MGRMLAIGGVVAFCSVFVSAVAGCSSFGEDTPPADGGSGDAGEGSAPAEAGVDAAPSPYATAVIGDRAFLYWRLGERGGTLAADSTPRKLDGTYESAGVLLGQPSLLAGDSDTAVRVTAGSSIVRAADSALSFAGNKAFAVECWVKLASTPPDTAVLVARMQDDGSLVSGYALRLEKDGRVYVQRGEGSDVSHASEDALALNVPHHVVGVYDGTAIRLYVDGVHVGFSNTPIALGDRPIDFTVGRYAKDTGNLDAVIDEVAVYDYALPADRVKAHYEIGVIR